VILVFRLLAVLFAVLTYVATFDESPQLSRVVGCGLVALTAATLSLARPLPPTPPGGLRRLDEKVWDVIKPRRYRP
jgi:hypothetical protein